MLDSRLPIISRRVSTPLVTIYEPSTQARASSRLNIMPSVGRRRCLPPSESMVSTPQSSSRITHSGMKNFSGSSPDDHSSTPKTITASAAIMSMMTAATSLRPPPRILRAVASSSLPIFLFSLIKYLLCSSVLPGNVRCARCLVQGIRPSVCPVRTARLT